MKILKEIGNLLSPNDPELVEKTLQRLDEQDRWNDVFSTKLFELLDKSDVFQERMRIAASKQSAAEENLRHAKEQLNRAQAELALADDRLQRAINHENKSRMSLEAALVAEQRAVEHTLIVRKVSRQTCIVSIVASGALCLAVLTLQALILPPHYALVAAEFVTLVTIVIVVYRRIPREL